MKYTSEQQRCVDHGGGDLVVSAAAGSGKTAVLTARIAELVRTRRAGIDEMLVVTFTRAAALELTHRVRARLLEALEAAPKSEAAYLERQIELIGGAYIGTVHAFCARVLRRHFAAAQLDPAFRVMDETKGAALMLEAAEEALEAAALEGAESFLALFDSFGGRDGQALIELVQRLYALTRSQTDAKGYAERVLRAYAHPVGDSLDILMDEARRVIGSARALTLKARDALTPPEKAIAVLDDDLMSYNSLMLACSKGPDELKRHLDDLSPMALRFSKLAGEDEKALAKHCRNCAKKRIEGLSALFPLTQAEELSALSHMLPALGALFALCDRFSEIYEAKKQEQGVVDFGDLEHKTLLALGDEAVAGEYRRRFKYVFMDEYQDTNRVQDALISRLARGNLFLVGDVKQSIYRFRLADPELFIERFNGAKEAHRASLPHNFRSTKAVIDAVNAVFAHTMTRGLGGVDYEGIHALTATRAQDGPRPEAHIFSSRAEDDDELETAEREAVFAARRIRELIGKPIYDGGKPLECSDCALLLRSTREAALTFARRLALEGIPVRADAIGGIFDAIEVQVFRNLLRAIDNRRLDVPMLSVMRSPIFAFTDAQLATVRLNRGESVYDDVVGAADGEGVLAEKCRELIDAFEGWKLDARLLPVDELIDLLLTQTGYLSVVSALPGGEQRAANLLALKEHARSSAPKSLWAFLLFLDSLERSKRPLPGQTAGGLNAVRIMSVHRSKGLEFPLVIVAGLGKRFNMMDVNAGVLMSKAGVAMKCVRPLDGLAYDTMMKSALRTLERRETLAEELRILYVALTRARDALVLIGSAQNLEKRLERAKTDTPHDADAPLDWLLQTLDACANAQLSPIDAVFHSEAPKPSDMSEGSKEAFESFIARQKLSDASHIDEAFAFEYPYERAAQVPSKLSVSELSRTGELTLSPPAFLAKPTHADVGTLAHDALQRIDLAGACDETAVRAVLEAMAEAEAAPEATLRRVDARAIAAFLNSPLGLRLRRSGRIERETRFQLFVPAQMLIDGFDGENVLLQGVIDCCFIEKDAWVLIDYKTDYVADGDFLAASKKHQRQIELYAHALKTLTGKPVSEGYIHFLRYGKSVELFR